MISTDFQFHRAAPEGGAFAKWNISITARVSDAPLKALQTIGQAEPARLGDFHHKMRKASPADVNSFSPGWLASPELFICNEYI
jgi:hypothetical protein